MDSALSLADSVFFPCIFFIFHGKYLFGLFIAALNSECLPEYQRSYWIMPRWQKEARNNIFLILVHLN